MTRCSILNCNRRHRAKRCCMACYSAVLRLVDGGWASWRDVLRMERVEGVDGRSILRWRA